MKHFELAMAEVGVKEWKQGNNPVVLAYYKDAGFPNTPNDEVAWCAAFVGAMLARAGLATTKSLMARSYMKYGEAVDIENVQEGDIVVFPRGANVTFGHVAFFVKKRGVFIDVLGGNQSDSVNIKSRNVSNIIAIRRPLYPVTSSVTAKPLSFWQRIVQFFQG